MNISHTDPKCVNDAMFFYIVGTVNLILRREICDEVGNTDLQKNTKCMCKYLVYVINQTIFFKYWWCWFV